MLCRANTTQGTTYDIVLVDDVPNLGCLGIEVAKDRKADLPRLQSIKMSASGAAPSSSSWQPHGSRVLSSARVPQCSHSSTANACRA